MAASAHDFAATAAARDRAGRGHGPGRRWRPPTSTAGCGATRPAARCGPTPLRRWPSPAADVGGRHRRRPSGAIAPHGAPCRFTISRGERAAPISMRGSPRRGYERGDDHVDHGQGHCGGRVPRPADVAMLAPSRRRPGSPSTSPASAPTAARSRRASSPACRASAPSSPAAAPAAGRLRPLGRRRRRSRRCNAWRRSPGARRQGGARAVLRGHRGLGRRAGLHAPLPAGRGRQRAGHGALSRALAFASPADTICARKR